MRKQAVSIDNSFIVSFAISKTKMGQQSKEEVDLGRVFLIACFCDENILVERETDATEQEGRIAE